MTPLDVPPLSSVALEKILLGGTEPPVDANEKELSDGLLGGCARRAMNATGVDSFV